MGFDWKKGNGKEKIRYSEKFNKIYLPAGNTVFEATSAGLVIQGFVELTHSKQKLKMPKTTLKIRNKINGKSLSDILISSPIHVYITICNLYIRYFNF